MSLVKQEIVTSLIMVLSNLMGSQWTIHPVALRDRNDNLGSKNQIRIKDYFRKKFRLPCGWMPCDCESRSRRRKKEFRVMITDLFVTSRRLRTKKSQRFGSRVQINEHYYITRQQLQK